MARTGLKVWILGLLWMTTSTACGSIYYGAMEKLGFEKRDILVDRVKSAREEQAETKEVFASALEEFRALVDMDGGDLEKQYDRLSASYERSKSQASDVRARVEAVRDVATRLFREWDDELERYQSADLRRRSESQLDDTRKRYQVLIKAMDRATERMDPVLELYEDQVLFLKHNLNARAIAALDAESIKIAQRVDTLIDEMNSAIEEADTFIASMS